ncbi:MAG: hypothetical protein COB49_01630 [Alphaproteobacteria bacterium]|nr:MAG: hypothetical protein COB49_01630 [Alphaproteobacteria bacterium]
MFFSQLMTKRLLTVFIAIFLTACSEENTVAGSEQNTLQQPNLPVLEVYKRPTCRCCSKWMTHLEDNGFETKAHNKNYLSALKTKKNIQPQYQSCHTAISKDGYVFEGHIPAKYIHQFLQEKPESAIGLAVPAMPVGSPGMEVGSKFRPYDILLLKVDGSAEIYARINTQKEQY